MSLEGNLEDLGLGEILQIVSLSRKSGTLSLHSKGREAAIVFRQGQVVRASSSMFAQSLGELLTQKSVIDPTILRKAIALQQSEGFLERLGAILVKHFDVAPQVLEDVVREQVETVVISLFEWTTGSYDFQIQDQVEMVYDTRQDPLQFMLDQGLNPQYLAMEGIRIQEEKSNAISTGSFGDGAVIDYIHEVDTSYSPSRSRLQIKKPVVIVDDDGPSLQAVAALLREEGYDVHALSRSEDTLIKVDALIRAGEDPTILIDLIMPKMDGSGVLGGIELLELLCNNFKDISIIIMTDYHYTDAETRVRERGCPFLLKPRRGEIANPELLADFRAELLNQISAAQAGEPPTESGHTFNLGDEMRRVIDDGTDNAPVAAAESDTAGALTLLRGMLDELNNPDLQGGVLLLLLRFASEFMNRAIVFMVHDKVVSGVGQFGITDDRVSGNDKVRSINFPLDAGTLFSVPARIGQPSIFKPEATPLNTHIFKQLGGGMPAEVFIGPIVSKSRLIGFLYGDNLPDQAPITGTEILEIFLSQAGLAMERNMQAEQGAETA